MSYVSRAARELTDDDVYAIAREARENNALDGITGLMIYDGRHFVQITEGAAPSVADLLERIQADDRHGDLRIVRDAVVEARKFAGWAMELALVDDATKAPELIEAKFGRSLDDESRAVLEECAALIAADQPASMTKISPP